jgi:hypothetical protein
MYVMGVSTRKVTAIISALVAGRHLPNALPLRLIEQVMWQAVRRSWKGPLAYRQRLDYPSKSGEHFGVSDWISYRS